MKTNLLLLFTLLVFPVAWADVTLEWDKSPNHNQVHHYVLVSGPEPNYYTNLQWVPVTVTVFDHIPSATMTNLPPGTNYVNIMAERNNVLSPFGMTNDLVVFVPDPPANLRVVAGSVINIRIEVVEGGGE